MGLGSNFWPGKGGEKISAYINGEEVATFYSELIEPQKPWSWKIPLQSKKHIKVNAGDVISESATYSNYLSVPVKDASSMLGFYFAPDEY